MTLENLKQYRPGVMLADDESNAVHRIRAGREVHAWLRGMTAEERGAVLTEAYARARAGAAGVEAGPAGVEPDAVKVVLVAGPAAASAKQGNHLALLDALAAGGRIEGMGEQFTLTRADGSTLPIPPKTAAHMVQKGMLARLP